MPVPKTDTGIVPELSLTVLFAEVVTLMIKQEACFTMRTGGILFLFALIIAAVLLSGCTSQGGTPGKSAPVSPADVTQPVGAHDPIIGAWRQVDPMGDDNRFQFNADGTYTSSMMFNMTKTTRVFYGTWKSAGNNSYVLNQTGTQAGPERMVMPTMLIIYSPAQKTIAYSDSPTWSFTPFTGEIMTASPTVKQ